MLQWLKSLFRPPKPAGPPRTIRHFDQSDDTITQEVVKPSDDGWLADVDETQTIRFFEVENPQVDKCLLTYRADLKCEAVRGQSYLELWCRLPGRGEFFSKGFHNAIKGTNDWGSYEIPFYLKAGQQPDLIKLNVVIEGGGKVWTRNIELTYTPLQ